ncbi:MAG: hypothetical protein K8R74_11365, partial [Bacteroidales bacterium]|nr:hypothetical protein [Bacteroidales bacterium]
LAKGKKIKIRGEAGFEYAGQGDKTLINGILGSHHFTDGEWLGFQGQDIEIIIDMEEITPISLIVCRFLENQRAWIFNPKMIEVQLSKNGKDYIVVKTFITNATEQKGKESFVKYNVSLQNQKARFIKVISKSIGTIPKWHPGSGGKAWIFVDEIIVE